MRAEAWIILFFVLITPLGFTGGIVATHDDVTTEEVASQVAEESHELEKQTRERLGIDPPANPWGEDEINILVVDRAGTDREYTPLVEESAAYWNRNFSATEFDDGQFVVHDSLPSDYTPEIRVEVVDDIEQCGTHQDGAVGCANVYSEVWSAEAPTIVRVEAGYSDNSTVDIVTHELGHTLGLRHGDAAEWPVMTPEVQYATVKKPNATERANPWQTDELLVYYQPVEKGQSLNETLVEQYDIALDYYSEDAAGGFVPEPVSLVRTETKQDAHITLGLADSVPSGDSTATWRGLDPDEDGELEYHTSATILIDQDVPTSEVSWHAGYSIGTTFGVANRSELPEPFRDPVAANQSTWHQAPETDIGLDN